MLAFEQLQLKRNVQPILQPALPDMGSSLRLDVALPQLPQFES
jgi:hypothetical protein